MKKTPKFIAWSIVLTLLFYMLAYYLLPPPPPSAAMVLLFAAVAMLIIWAVDAGIKKFGARRGGDNATRAAASDSSRPGPGTHVVVSFLILGMGMACMLTACSRAPSPTPTRTEAPAPVSAEPPSPPPPQEGPTSAERMPRVTGRAILLPSQKEEPGYGLYSYALMSHHPEGVELPRFKAFLKALLDLPTAAAVERSVPRRRINITYLLLETLAPGWDTLSADDKVNYVVDHYDYARGAAMVASLSQRTGPGPVIISLLKPINMAEHPRPVLVQDLTTAQPQLMTTYVSYFVGQAAKDQFWQQSALSRFSLTLRNGLEVAAAGLGMSKDAVDTWVKYFK